MTPHEDTGSSILSFATPSIEGRCFMPGKVEEWVAKAEGAKRWKDQSRERKRPVHWALCVPLGTPEISPGLLVLGSAALKNPSPSPPQGEGWAEGSPDSPHAPARGAVETDRRGGCVGSALRARVPETV